MNSVNLELLKAGLTLLIALITLGLGWLIGQRLTFKWNLLQKRRETDIANVQQFYALYGEFKEVSKIWRVIKRNKGANLTVPPDGRWPLMARACAIEGKNEAILVKLATERHLATDDLRYLGLFRQAIQMLRESIRDDVEMRAGSRGAEYAFFNGLAAKVGLIVFSSPPDQLFRKLLRQLRVGADEISDPERASKQLEAIVGVRSPHFKAELEHFEETHPNIPDENIRDIE
ncbi:MAG TPA: hypothetical protein VJ890_10115 [Vineibacter sp.]|nr:hypothetical protein [Vineibacter sp.]